MAKTGTEQKTVKPYKTLYFNRFKRSTIKVNTNSTESLCITFNDSAVMQK